MSTSDRSSPTFVPQTRPQLDVTESAKLEREHEADLVGTRYVRTDHDPKKASNREHQRRFRLRQKVGSDVRTEALSEADSHSHRIDILPNATSSPHVRVPAQARAQAVEQQLASTTAELQGLKARQLELEVLLQNAHISKDQSTLSAVSCCTAEAYYSICPHCAPAKYTCICSACHFGIYKVHCTL